MVSAAQPTIGAGATAAPASTPAENQRFPLFDGLRAVAILCVVVTHTAALSHLNEVDSIIGPITARLDSGVALFFVISGFLIYRPFVAARVASRPPPRLARYARRRLLRLVPAYWLALTVLAVWPGLPGVHTSDWWVYYGFLQNTSNNTVTGGIGPAWSLCVEVSFYALLPLYSLLVRRRWGARNGSGLVRRELSVLAGLAFASITVRMLAFEGVGPDVPVSNTIAGTFTWFALGMSLAVASVAYAGRETNALPAALRVVARRPEISWLVAAALLVIVSRLGIPLTVFEPYTAAQWFVGPLFYGAFALCLALPAVFGDGTRGLPARVLRWRPLAWLGLVSYGVFLWHLPLATELTAILDDVGQFEFVTYFTATLAAATACATVSYYALERPLLRIRERSPRPPAVPLATARGIAD